MKYEKKKKYIKRRKQERFIRKEFYKVGKQKNV